MKLISRKSALESGKRYYYTGYPCVNGHVAQRYTNGHGCIECMSGRAKARQTADPERFRVYAKRYYASRRLLRNAGGDSGRTSYGVPALDAGGIPTRAGVKVRCQSDDHSPCCATHADNRDS